MEGIVISSTGSWFEVAPKWSTGGSPVPQNQEQSESRIAMCKVRGNFRLKAVKTTNPVAVGDHVEYTPDPKLRAAFPDKECGWITAVHERRNCIIRKSVNLSKQTHIIASNIDMAFLVASLTYPRTPQGFIDRFLVAAEAYKVPVTIVFNKTDLYGEDEMAELAEMERIYTPIGYEVLSTSAVTGNGMDVLIERLKNRVCLFSGNSGVGKSALVHAIDPTLDIRIGEISDTHLKGRHTTTYARMYPIRSTGGSPVSPTKSTGGSPVLQEPVPPTQKEAPQTPYAYLIDTPGIKEFGMVQLKTDELSLYFPEMQVLIHNCRFNNCTHTHEPGCAVKQAVEEGRISAVRYKSYLNILNGDEVPEPGLLTNKNERK